MNTVRRADRNEDRIVNFQFYFEMIGVVAFAISGAALGARKGMDLFGVAMMGMTTAVGGGILRDVLLGLTPPSALRDPLQALVAIATSLLLFIVWKKWHPSGNHRVWESVLLAADSLGLGIFSVHGAAVAIRAGYGANVFLVLLVGVLTGVGGGVLRDVFSGERPYIFVRHFYACASIIGALICALCWERLGANAAMLFGAAAIVVLRLLAAYYHWSLPKSDYRDEPQTPAATKP